MKVQNLIFRLVYILLNLCCVFIAFDTVKQKVTQINWTSFLSIDANRTIDWSNRPITARVKYSKGILMEDKQGFDALLSDIFSPYRVLDYTVQPLSNRGQHFCSVVKKVKVHIDNKNGNSEIDLIIKIMPLKGSHVEDNLKLKFMKEIDFYQKALPQYQKIQRSNNLTELNLFPHFYKATGEVIVLGDLHSDNFIECDNFLDENQTELVLQELAKFHATGIALKLSYPDIYESQLASVVVPALQNAGNQNRDEINMKLRSEVITLLKSNGDFENLAEPVDSILSNIDNTRLPTPSEPFSTLLHNDLWRGNILFKYSVNSAPVEVKFIDFQTMIYNSPARDLIYFLFTSVDDKVLCNFLHLLEFYHSVLINHLSDLGCETSDFTLDELINEVNMYGPSKLKHIILLFKALCSSDSEKLDFEQCLQRVVILFRDRGWLKKV